MLGRMACIVQSFIATECEVAIAKIWINGKVALEVTQRKATSMSKWQIARPAQAQKGLTKPNRAQASGYNFESGSAKKGSCA